MKTNLSVLAICASLLQPAFAAGKVLCWTDENGHRACGDRVPPKYADREREVINRRGVTVDTKAREKTAEEAAAEVVARQRVEEQEMQRRKQAAYDRFLLETYQSVAELEQTRAERVAALQTRLTLSEKAAKNSQATLDALHAQAAQLNKEGKPVDRKLEAQIRDYLRALGENVKAVEHLKSERDTIDAQFTRDIERYKELRQPQPPP
jgi:hypothetical protein